MRLVVVTDPFDLGAPGDEAADDERPTPLADVVIRNEAATPIGISSHIHLAEVNPRLRLDRAAAFGMRPALATGDVLWIEAGSSITLSITEIGGSRVMVGNTGLVDGPLDSPEVRNRALMALRACGYLDMVDGVETNDLATAEQAVAGVMRLRSRADG